MTVVEHFHRYVANGHATSSAVIGPDNLPYPARFIADPFIRRDPRDETLHLFCEALVTPADKRIVHFTSSNAVDWTFAGDVISENGVSFPSVHIDDHGDFVLAPQFGDPIAGELMPYHLSPEGKATARWSLSLGDRARDKLVITHPDTSIDYVLFGGRERWGQCLKMAQLSARVTSLSAPVITSRSSINERSLIKMIAHKALRPKRLANRPAGDVLENSADEFTVPIQAAHRGDVYGEMIALTTIGWRDLKVRRIKYVAATTVSPDFARIHHVSHTVTSSGPVFVIDAIGKGLPGDAWRVHVITCFGERAG